MKTKSALLAAVLLLWAATVNSDKIRFDLNEVSFDDGGTASGYVIFDTEDQKIRIWNIRVSGGNERVFPPFTYSRANSVDCTQFDKPSPSVLCLTVWEPGGTNEQNRLLGWYFSPSLIDTATAYVIGRYWSGNPSSECFNCNPYRTVSHGALIPVVPSTAPPRSVTLGLYDAQNAMFYLRDLDTAALSTIAVSGVAHPVLPIMGAWQGQRDAGVGTFDRRTGQFRLRGNPANGEPDQTVFIAGTKRNWLPITGDWDGDGRASVGVFNPKKAQFFLKNQNTNGNPDSVLTFRKAPPGCLPIAGDWDGDGQATVGLYHPETRRFFLRYANTTGPAESSFKFLGAKKTWIPTAGDWDGDYVTTIGLYDPKAQVFYLRNDNSGGPAEQSVMLKEAPRAALPVVGQGGLGE